MAKPTLPSTVLLVAVRPRALACAVVVQKVPATGLLAGNALTTLLSLVVFASAFTAASRLEYGTVVRFVRLEPRLPLPNVVPPTSP